MRRLGREIPVAVVVLAFAAAAAADGVATPGASAPEPTQRATPERLAVDVLEVLPHDPDAFTQGLEWHAGLLLESTGLRGRSSLREVDPKTGVVRRRIELDPQFFGEGLTRVGDRLVQLTWRSGVAFVYDATTLTVLDRFTYEGEGWGLCFDGTSLVQSDGSSFLFRRDPTTFELRERIAVRRDGRPLSRLNELECVGDEIYANVWRTDEIVVIDPERGEVRATIDASTLLSPVERVRVDVLNGIAHDPQSGDFYVTGKLWPKLFRVRFVPR